MEAIPDLAIRDRYYKDMHFHLALLLKGRNEGGDVWTA